MFKPFTKKSSLDSVRGRYSKGGDTEVFPTRLGWWERDLSFMGYKVDDIEYLITITDQYSPDIISRNVYQRDDMGWLILQYNNIVDIMEELVAGRIIRMPSPQRVISDITI